MLTGEAKHQLRCAGKTYCTTNGIMTTDMRTTANAVMVSDEVTQSLASIDDSLRDQVELTLLQVALEASLLRTSR